MFRYALVLVASALAIVFFLVDFEPSFEPPPADYKISPRAAALHAESLVIDLHVDSLIWPRPLDEPGQGGQVDLPRMRAGGLDAAAFVTPTRFFGVAGLKAFHDRWPWRSWFSAWERFTFQLARMDQLVSDSGGRLQRTSRPSEIRDNHRRGVLSVFHGIEGAHALDGDLDRVHLLPELGVVFVGPVHLSDNEFATSSSGKAMLSPASFAGLTRSGEAS